MYKKYNPSEAYTNYDAIIIGSGLGGLTTAALMSMAQKRVLVLERHYVPGGFTHAFKRKNFKWDVGVHYVGQVNHHEASLRKAFDFITDGKLKWRHMGEIYDKAIIAGQEFTFVSGKENQLENLLKYFPDEELALKSYFAAVNKVSEGGGMFFGEKAMPPFLSKWVGRLLRRKFNFYSDKTTYDFLKELTNNEKLIAVLCAQCGDYGLPPKKSSFAIHAMIVDHYLNGGNYPVGGASEIYHKIIEVIRKNGGEVVIRAEVKEIVLQNNKAVGVTMAGGEQIFAKKIISNAGARNTFTQLISGQHKSTESLKSDLQKVKPSVAHLCLYVGIDKSDAELNLPKYNYWVYNSFDFDGDYENHLNEKTEDPPLFYISFPSAKDEEWQINNPGISTIQIMIACSYDRIKKWEQTKWMKRGEEYNLFKEQLTQKMLKKLYEIVPQVNGHVVMSELSTPLSTKHFSNYQQGEIYGLEHTPARFRLNWLRPQSPFKNLYLTGQDTLTVGVGGALFSGVITASTILKKNFMSKIEKYNTIKS